MRHAIAHTALSVLLLAAGSLAAEPTPEAQARITAAESALAECTQRACTTDEMQARVAELNAARAAADGAEPPAPAVDPPPPEPPAPEPLAGPSPPAFAPGARPAAPPDTGSGAVWMQRQQLGLYWGGVGLFGGGMIGLAVSVPVMVTAIQENEEDVAAIAIPGGIGALNLTLAIVGVSMMAADLPMVPETVGWHLTADGFAVHF
jgi:hypothetical protein